MLAPISESTRQPTNPLPAMIATLPGDASPLISQKSVAIEQAPRKPPAVPFRLIPPSVPGGTCFQLVIRRVGPGLRLPSSVAQVSAVTAAMTDAVMIIASQVRNRNQRS